MRAYTNGQVLLRVVEPEEEVGYTLGDLLNDHAVGRYTLDQVAEAMAELPVLTRDAEVMRPEIEDFEPEIA